MDAVQRFARSDSRCGRSARGVSHGLLACLLTNCLVTMPQLAAHSRQADTQIRIDSKQLDDKTDKVAIAIMNEYQFLMGEGVTVQVTPLPDNQYAVVISGTVEAAQKPILTQKARDNRPAKYVPEQFLKISFKDKDEDDATIKSISDFLTVELSKYASSAITPKVVAVTTAPKAADPNIQAITDWYQQIFLGDDVTVKVGPLPKERLPDLIRLRSTRSPYLKRLCTLPSAIMILHRALIKIVHMALRKC